MSTPPRGMLDRVRQVISRRRDAGVRESIAELVQQSADQPGVDGVLPDLDRQERALIANLLRLRGTSADDVMIPRADIVAMPVDVTLDAALDLFRSTTARDKQKQQSPRSQQLARIL